ncbi:hypothetical protein VTI74DRAFT_7404 [Chaetomium olivicolor]
MIAVGKMQNRCPGCRAQLLSFYDALLLPRTRPHAPPFLRRGAQPSSSSASAASAGRPWRPNSIRQFSTSRIARQEPTEPSSTTPAQTADEIEAVVRQARQTFGGTLPADYLSPDEYKVYERLYGPPLRETRPEDVGIPFPSPESSAPNGQHVLLRTTEHGTVEEVEYTFDPSTAIESEGAIDVEEGSISDAEVLEALELASQATVADIADAPIDYLHATARNQREYNALLKLQRDFEAASLQPAEEIHEEENIIEEEEPREEDEIDEDEGEPDATFLEGYEHRSERLHVYTRMGQFKTNPSTVQLPKPTFIEPITSLLARTDINHIKETAERELGGPGLPYGPATPKSLTNLPQKGILMEAGHHRMSPIEADAYLATVLPGVYASVLSVLVEVRKRLGDEWLKGMLTRPDGAGPRVLDAGAGGAGLLAWQDVLQAGWEVLREKGEVKGREPHGKKTVVVGSENLRQRVSRFLHNTTFLPRLPDYIHSIEGAERKLDSGGGPAPRKVFDVIIASHMLMPLEKEYKRKELLDNLWSMLSPEGGVLIFLEKGHPRGFEAVANVRDRILDEFIIPPTAQPLAEDMIQPEAERVRERGMIIAPCTNHGKCPMYFTPGLSHGRKDFCHFSQRFIRPPFLQKVLGATHRSHEDIKFSYLAVRRGGAQPDASSFLHGKAAADRAFAGYEDADTSSPADAPHPLALPRNILPPLKRRGHVTLDVCTPAATIERWVVPKSFSKQAYHDARKAVWGDLWALGAKTRTVRPVRLGKGGVDLGDGGVRSREAAAANKRRPKVVDIAVDPRYGVVGATERGREQPQRRTKGGKKRVRLDDLMTEMGADQFEDPDDAEDREFMRS